MRTERLPSDLFRMRLLMTLERARLLECGGMETRDQAIEKGVPRKWKSQRGTLGLKNL